MKRAIAKWGALAAAVAVASAFAVSSLQKSLRADHCVDRLMSAATSGDRERLEDLVRSTSFREAVLRSAKTELLFVRPAGAGWSRVGLTLQRTATSAPEVTFLRLGHEEARCIFVQDYGVD